MKKHNRLLIIYFLLFGLLSFQSDLVLAQEEKKVYITFIYEKIEEIIDVRGKTDEEIEQIESEIASESCIPYESKSKDYVYKLKPSIITSEKELLEAMGAKSEQFLKYGQKCLLSAYRAATSEKLQLKAEGLEDKDYLEIVLIDTSNDGNDFGNGYDTSKFGLEPDIRNDFWPCSYVYEPKIQLSDVEYKYQKTTFIDLLNLNIKSGKKDIASTVNHEYAHFLDDTIFNQKKYNVENMYGLDGHHRGDEITNQGVAFIEGWAEYNEMIEYSKKVRNYKKYTKSLVEESDSIAGLYFDVAPKDCDFSTLLKSEAYNALLLYRLSQKLGQEKINEAFIKTRDNRYRDLKDLVKKLVELHPEDTETICKVVDRVFYNKASKEELLEMVGETEATKSYVENRKIRNYNTILTIESLLYGNYSHSNNKDSSKKGVFSRFVSNVKENLSKGIEKLRNTVDTIFDKIKSKFKKDEAIAEAEETNEAQETPDDEPCKVIKKKNPLHSNNQKVGPSSNPFSVVK